MANTDRPIIIIFILQIDVFLPKIVFASVKSVYLGITQL